VSGFSAALWSEWLKARRSKAPWLMAAGLCLAPLAIAFFMVILKDPDWARQQGLISAKAQMTAAVADWPTYLGFLEQAIAAGGLAVFGLILIWFFGREHSDRTVKDLLALPTSREAIVTAKFAVASGWSVATGIIVYLLGLALGHAIGLPGWSTALALQASTTAAVITVLTILLAVPFAWAASAGRGYLPPIGCMGLVVALAQILARLGWGEFFPWCVPALLSGATGPAGGQPGLLSYIIVVLTGLAGLACTLTRWRYGDQN
jgi:ABC-2 type transport system permease protein